MHGPTTIMLVNQNSDVACAIKNKLQRRGYKICQVANYTQALDGIRKGHTGPVIANLDQSQDLTADMRAFLAEARQRQIKTIGISDTPASLDHNLTVLVEVLVITPGPWDDLLREVGICHHRRRSQNFRRRLEHPGFDGTCATHHLPVQGQCERLRWAWWPGFAAANCHCPPMP